MTTRRFPFRRTDDGISVIIPAPKSKREGEGERDWLDRVVGKTVAEHHKRGEFAEMLPECDAADLPSREYRDAWRANADGSIRVDEQIKQQIITERAKPTMEERVGALEAKR